MDVCSICLNTLYRDSKLITTNIAITECHHMFHLSCLSLNAEYNQNKCPCCRHEYYVVSRQRPRPNYDIESQDPVEASQDSVEASQDSVEASFAPPGNWIIIVIGCVSVVVCATIVYALGVILKLLCWAIENQFSAIFKCVANLIK